MTGEIPCSILTSKVQSPPGPPSPIHWFKITTATDIIIRIREGTNPAAISGPTTAGGPRTMPSGTCR